MLSKISLVINAILLILVINLYMNKESEVVEEAVSSVQENTELRIAYLNTDSLDKNYLYANAIVEELEKEFEKKQRRLERKAEKTQQEFNNLQQSARSMTPVQLQAAQQRVVQMEQEIQIMQNQMAEEFAEEQAEMQQKLVDRLDSFLLRYNDSAHYDYIVKKHLGSQILVSNPAYDITEEVLELLNNEYSGEESENPQ